MPLVLNNESGLIDVRGDRQLVDIGRAGLTGHIVYLIGANRAPMLQPTTSAHLNIYGDVTRNRYFQMRGDDVAFDNVDIFYDGDAARRGKG